MEQYMPESIRRWIGKESFTLDTVGRSHSTILCFPEMVLKIEKECEESNNEHKILHWLQGKLPVPKIIVSEKVDGRNYLLMSKVEGVMSCDKYYLGRPKELIHLTAEGLKMLWAADIFGCPCLCDLKHKLRQATDRVENGLCNMETVQSGTYGRSGFHTPVELLEWLIANKPHEHLVFSHGDYCQPNIFMKEGRITGFIDLGRAGLADRWQDIALCIRSMEYNLGSNGEYAAQLFQELNIEPDWEKIRYYILLDELF